MSTELPAPDCPPLRVRILGENLIAFRTTSGKVGVVANACPHRGASLFFGRNEEEGLRCVYHGWKFDVDGNCVDMPSEPPESNFKQKVKATSYPTHERGGLIWMYMGPRSVPPPLPSLVANMQPEGSYDLGAYSSECNWLQSLEGDYDTIHVGFLHGGSIRPEDIPLPDPSLEYYAKKTRWSRWVVADTEFGCTSAGHRPAEDDSTYWRIAHFLFPFYAMIPGSFRSRGFIAVIPVDDENCLRFTMSALDGNRPRRTGGPGAAFVDGMPTSYHPDPSHNTSDWLGRFRIAGNARNDYLIDREVQRAKLSEPSGIGWSGIPGRGQDNGVTESMGPIYQRDNEHLGVTDMGIIRMRRLLLNAAKALRDNGTVPPGVDEPELYRVRSVITLLPNGVNGIEATKNLQWSALTEEAPQLEAKA
jgi:nitrite reductase/ring-hydroxylating ferredoxin subunit